MSSNSVNRTDQPHRAEIVIAIITVTGVLGAALFANWDKVFSARRDRFISGRVNTGHEYSSGQYTGFNYKGEAKVFFCSRGLNMNTNRKEGISAFCVLDDGALLERGQYTGRNFGGKHSVFPCPNGTYNAESGSSHGIFAWCYDGDGLFVRAQNTGRTYGGRYKVFKCQGDSINLESGSKEGISSVCQEF
ncbi:MAG: hypothetical protein GY856_50400 [bacterium]|nr:hypothetical protein [bacterium]